MSGRIVVTGALGHIGSRLIRELPSAFPEAELVMIDDLSTQRYASLFHLPQGRYRFVEADVLEAGLPALFSGAECVVHLAALTEAEQSARIPKEVERVNLRGTERVASACLAARCPLIFPSTTSVYGVASGTALETSRLAPQSPYAASKLRAEKLLASLKGLRFVVLRFATIFGVSPGMRFHTAVNRFAWQACQGRPLSVWKDALDQRRPYLDLGDAVGAALFFMRRGLFDRRVYNVATTVASVGEIVELLRARVPDLKTAETDSPVMNRLSYGVSCARLESLGFRFQGSLAAGIDETVRLLVGPQKKPKGRA